MKTAHDPAFHDMAAADAVTAGTADGARETVRDPAAGAQGRAGRALVRALLDLGGGLLGALPVLWVVGAVPWRSPSLLIDVMFRGFTSCALESGALNPIVMLCPRVGAPLGMYQIDGGLSYPLGGVLIRLGAAPLTAWKMSVALLVVAGFVALFHVGRRATGSLPVALALVVVSGLGGTLSARSWNWYWNITAIALLALVFATLHAVLDRARSRSVAQVVPAGAAVLGSVLLVALEWSYAGMFAAAVALMAVVIVILQRGWGLWRRLLLLAGGLAGAAAVFWVQRERLRIAGITEQVRSSYETATRHSIDVAPLVVPDADSSYLGLALRGTGLEDVLAPAMTEGNQLWVAPYLGVLTLGLLTATYLWRHGRLRRGRGRRPPGFLPLLLVVTAGSVVASLGPVVHVANLALPDASYMAWTSPLWAQTPLRWIRYPWTWGFLTHVALLLTIAVLTPALFRRGRSWSPLVWVLAVVVALEFVSPPVLDAIDGPHPSVSTAPSDNLISHELSREQPAIARFEAEQLPELHRALARIDGPVTLLPWGNTWIAPHLAGDHGATLRNVGIDRNVKRAMSFIPDGVGNIRVSSPELVAQLLDSGWTNAVVVLDHVPTAGSIVVHAHGHLPPGRARWQRRKRRIEHAMALAGACVEPHSWFSVITRCATQGPVAAVAEDTRS